MWGALSGGVIFGKLFEVPLLWEWYGFGRLAKQTVNYKITTNARDPQTEGPRAFGVNMRGPGFSCGK